MHVFSRFQSKMQFVPWACSNAMKIGLCSVPPPGLTSSVLSLINTSNMSSLFKDVAQKFNKLYKRKVNMCYSLFYLWCNCISTCWHVFTKCLIWILVYTLSVMAEFFIIFLSPCKQIGAQHSTGPWLIASKSIPVHNYPILPCSTIYLETLIIL